MTGDDARETFAALIEAHGGLVHKVARVYAWTAPDRDDLVQDILAQAWRAFPGYDPARPFGTWLYRIALNVAISWLRRHAPRQRRTVPLDVDLHEAISAMERSDLVAEGSGLSWATAKRSITSALRVPGVSEIWLAGGRYFVDNQDRESTIAIGGDIAIRGGFVGTETSLEQRPVQARTAIDGYGPTRPSR